MVGFSLVRVVPLAIALSAVLMVGCNSTGDEINNDPGPDDIRGDGGAGGSGGTAGEGGTAGDGGSAGEGGTAGDGGSAGDGGTAGDGGSGGSGGTGGSDFMFSEDFESGIDPWFADNGVWEVGEQPDPATSGPDGCFSGAGCAATVLDGVYPGAGGGTGCSGAALTSRLISGIIVLPAVAGNEELHLRFWNWFGYRRSVFCADHGQVQISVADSEGGFGPWVSVGTSVSTSSAVWSIKDVELTDYAGETVRIAFLNTAGVGGGAGWYIDDVEILKKAPAFTGDFEGGWDDWSASNGVWEVGEQPDPATSGPDGCFSGSGCAATVLDGVYPGAGGGTGCSGAALTSRLISATFVLPTVSGIEELRLRFWNWFHYRSAFFCSDHGQVQIAVRNENGTFGGWISVGTFVSDQSGWTQKNVDLTLYAGETVRMAFLHTAGVGDGAGWFIDDIEFVTF